MGASRPALLSRLNEAAVILPSEGQLIFAAAQFDKIITREDLASVTLLSSGRYLWLHG